MSSLRRRLFFRLLVGLGGLGLCAVVVIYGVVHKSLLNQMDAELRMIAADIPSLLPEGGAIPQANASERMLEFFMQESGFYFEVWDEDLIFSDRSPSLGEMELPIPETFTSTPAFMDTVLSNGEAVRVISVRQASRLLGSPVMLEHNVVAARNREALDQQLKLLVAGCLVVAVLGALLAGLIVRISVLGALRPLKQIDDQLSAVDADSLANRFSSAPLPDELRPVIERLNELMARLQASFERERRFSADLAHELRTPVAELKALAEVAIKWPEQADPGQFQDVLNISDEMQRTIEALLALTRLEQGQLEATTRVNLAGLVEKAWRPLAEKAAERKLHCRFDMDEQLEIEGHPELLMRILSNLLQNAVEYTPEGGTLELKAAAMSTGFRLVVSNEVDDDFDPDTLEHIFDRFWRGDRSRTVSGHSGLGLTLAQSCALAMQMKLRAEYTIDKHLQFIIENHAQSQTTEK